MDAKRVEGNLIDPADKAWEGAPAERIQLAATPLAAQPSRYVRASWADRTYGLVREIEARAAHDGESLYLRLEWSSPTAALEAGAPASGDGALPGTVAADGGLEHPIEGPDAFPDAAAAMFPANGGAPLEAMGSDDSPVSIWRWTPGGTDAVEDLVATGLGTVRPAGTPNGLRARSASNGATRTVVLSRPLKPAAGGAGTAFKAGGAAQVAFAVWTGANQERAGIKSASPQWIDLDLEG